MGQGGMFDGTKQADGREYPLELRRPELALPDASGNDGGRTRLCAIARTLTFLRCPEAQEVGCHGPPLPEHVGHAHSLERLARV
jgi:hypothetical protein